MLNRFIAGFSLVAVSAIVAGCAGPETKLGRGIANTTELTRMGEFQSSIEQETLWGQSPDVGLATGMVKGIDNTLKRTGLGIYEVVTFPFPPYHAVMTNYVSEYPAHVDGYVGGHISEGAFDVDSYTGFSGGEVAPFFPGSQFNVFDN